MTEETKGTGAAPKVAEDSPRVPPLVESTRDVEPLIIDQLDEHDSDHRELMRDILGNRFRLRGLRKEERPKNNWMDGTTFTWYVLAKRDKRDERKLVEFHVPPKILKLLKKLLKNEVWDDEKFISPDFVYADYYHTRDTKLSAKLAFNGTKYTHYENYFSLVPTDMTKFEHIVGTKERLMNFTEGLEETDFRKAFDNREQRRTFVKFSPGNGCKVAEFPVKEDPMEAEPPYAGMPFLQQEDENDCMIKALANAIALAANHNIASVFIRTFQNKPGLLSLPDRDLREQLIMLANKALKETGMKVDGEFSCLQVARDKESTGKVSLGGDGNVICINDEHPMIVSLESVKNSPQHCVVFWKGFIYDSLRPAPLALTAMNLQATCQGEETFRGLKWVYVIKLFTVKSSNKKRKKSCPSWKKKAKAKHE